MEATNSKKLPITAFFMIIVLVASFITTLITLYYGDNKLFDIKISSFYDFIDGKAPSKIEKKYEDELVYRKQAIALWGAANYGLFNTGSKGVLVGDDGWFYSSEEFKSYEGQIQEEQYKIGLINEINNSLKSKNIQLLIALLPSKARIYNEHIGSNIYPDVKEKLYGKFRWALIKKNINTPDIYSELLKHKINTKLFMKSDTHWTPEGAEMVANFLSKNVSNNFLEKKFITEKSSIEKNSGDLMKFIDTGFFKRFIGPDDEEYNIYKTTASDLGGGLFGDEEINIALIGTSYSAIDKWNFEGALKAAFQADILNFAEEGKGPLAPMAKFLKETDFENTKLKLVIWEIPERFIHVKYNDIEFPDFIPNPSLLQGEGRVRGK